MVRSIILFIVFPAIAVTTVEARQLVETVSSDGRIQARLTVSPDEPRLSDTILLTLDVQADSTLRFDMPVFGKAMGELKIIDAVEQLAEVTDSGETKRLVLKMVPEQGGKAPIWPITIRYSERREEISRESSITLPASELEIGAEVTPESASLEKISPAPDIFDLRTVTYWIYGVIVGILVAAVFLFRILRRPKKAGVAESVLSPQEIAIRRIAQLVESRMYENDVKLFFIELTGIVRWYIERQTEIRAPELTTEEFLHEISLHWKRRNVLPPELRDRLRLFLESADMVKFAKFRPTQDEIMLGLRRAEEFVRKFVPEPEDDFDSFDTVS